MTDANLMDANCVHGEVWYECQACEAEMQAFFLTEQTGESQ
jgi:hypothetical protein